MDLEHRQPGTTQSTSNSRNMGATWECGICSAGFQRLDHFKRHTATHRTDRPFMCDFCGSLYKRGDILRRHWKSCSVRIQTGQAIPEPRLGGKEKHACDGCARLKRSCSGGQPCSECHTRGRTCSYQRLGGRGSPGSSPREWGGNSVNIRDMDQPQADGPSYRPSEPLRSTWDLGPQNLYASADVCYKAYSRLS